MASSPAFQFYPKDFLEGTAGMTDAEVGGYMRLLCVQWGQGALPDDDRRLRNITGGSSRALKAIRTKFVKGADGMLRNEKLERVRLEQDEYRESQRKNAQARWKQKKDATAHAMAMPSHMPTHMPTTMPNACSASASAFQSVSHAGAGEPPPDPNRESRAGIFDLFERWLNVSGRASWNSGPVVTWLATVECDPPPGGLALAKRCLEHAIQSPQSRPQSGQGAVRYVQAIYERCRRNDCEPGDFGADDGSRKTQQGPSRVRGKAGKYAGLAEVAHDEPQPGAVVGAEPANAG